MLRAVLPTAAVLALGACDSAEDRPTDWSYVHTAILRPSCATAACHSSLSAVAGLDLSTRDGAYAILTGRVCGAPCEAARPRTMPAAS